MKPFTLMSEVTTSNEFSSGPSHVFLHFNEKEWDVLQGHRAAATMMHGTDPNFCALEVWFYSDNYVENEEFVDAFADEFPESHHEMRNNGNFVLIPKLIDIPVDLRSNMEWPSRMIIDSTGFYVRAHPKHGDDTYTCGKVYWEYLESRMKEMHCL
jgi:hypothetical protein